MDLDALNEQLETLSEQELLALPAVNRWLQRNGARFRVDALPDELVDNGAVETTNFRIEVIRRGDGRWGVGNRLEQILGEDGQWHERPVPHEQMDHFRFPLHEAIARARAIAPTMRFFDKDPQQFATWLKER